MPRKSPTQNSYIVSDDMPRAE